MVDTQLSRVNLNVGAGKSMIFTLPPLLQLPGEGEGGKCAATLSLVISPLIALMESQVEALNARGIAAAVINSHQSPQQRQTVESELLLQEQGGVQVLFLTPEMAASPSFQRLGSELYRQDRICLVAIDEAHCVSHLFHNALEG